MCDRLNSTEPRSAWQLFLIRCILGRLRHHASNHGAALAYKFRSEFLHDLTPLFQRSVLCKYADDINLLVHKNADTSLTGEF